MDIASLAIFTGVLLVAAGSPGPSIAALVARILAHGHRDLLPFLAAMWIGEAVWLSLAVWGLSTIAQTFQLLFAAIKWAGVCYLLFLAWKMWKAPVSLAGDSVPVPASGLKMFASGLAITLGNPKIMVFYLSLLPTIIDLKTLTLTGWAELTAIMVIVLVVIDYAWVLFAVRARSILKSARSVRWTNRFSAGLMAAAAGAIAAR